MTGTDPEATDGHGFAPEMTPEEALMWRIGTDQGLDPSGTLLAITDRPIDAERLRRKLEAAVVTTPRMAERVVESGNPLAPPRWEVDPRFDIHDHVHEIELRAPHDRRTLLDLAAEIHTTPLPTDRSPWIMNLVTGLEDGRGALIARLHHAVADGIGALRMADAYLDLERDPPPPEPVDLAAVIAERAAAAPPREPADPVEFVIDALSGPLGLLRSAAAEVALIGADPARAQRTGSEALEHLRTVIDQVAGDPYLDSTSELWTQRSDQRYLVTARTPLETALAAARARGGKLNDLYVTALADAALAYHAELDAVPRSVAMSFVRSTREGEAAGGNAFVPIKIRAPGGDTGPDERFAALREAMAPSDTDDDPGLGSVSALASVIPTPVLSRLGRDQGRRIDVVTSNVRGAPMPIYVGGALVEESYPLGPVAGAACNATLMSYDGSLDIGIVIDPAAIDDPDRFGELVQATLDRYAAESEGP